MNRKKSFLFVLVVFCIFNISCNSDNCEDVSCAPWFFEQPDIVLLQFDTSQSGFIRTEIDSMLLVTKYRIMTAIDSSMMFEDNGINNGSFTRCINNWHQLTLCKLDPYGPSLPADSIFDGQMIIDSNRTIHISNAKYLVTSHKLREGACCGPPPTFELLSIDIDSVTNFPKDLPIAVSK